MDKLFFMNKVKLSLEELENLKTKGFKSVIILGASNSAELKDNADRHLLASKELVVNERITRVGFHVSIDDPVLLEICNTMAVFIEVP